MNYISYDSDGNVLRKFLRNSPPSPLFLLTLIGEISNSKERGGATEGGVIELYEDD